MVRLRAILLLGGFELWCSLATATLSSSASVRCYTYSGYSSCSHLPTTTTTTRHSCTAEVTKTPTTVITQRPPKKTITAHKTATNTVTVTASQSTDTFTTTITSTSTAVASTTTTSVTTSTSTSTSTSYTTQTIDTSPGFTPIASYTYTQPIMSSKRDEPVAVQTYQPAVKKVRDAASEISVNPKLAAPKIAGGKIECPKQLYPERVVCVKSIELIDIETKTAKSTKRVTSTYPAETTTTTVIVTTTSTQTVANSAASTTVTSTTSTTTTSTSTFTSVETDSTSTTTTAFVASSTQYPNCQANNMISQFQGTNINGVTATNGILADQFPVNTATDCCINCVNTPNCGGFAWAEGHCTLFNDAAGGSVCDPSIAVFSFSTGFLGFEQPPDTVGNANCGQGEYSGV